MKDEIKGTISQYEDFLLGIVWKDILNQMKLMREAVRDNLESCTDVEELYRFQGRAEVLRDLCILPDQILEALVEDKLSDKALNNNINGKDENHGRI